jgi:hypothetical protein
MNMSEQTPLELDHERWLREYELRKREIEIKERDQSRSRWSSPVVLAVLAAALAGLSNAAVTLQNGLEQRKLEAEKAGQAKIIEETKAEAARIFEVIKTGDADKSATNLKFLVDTGLITNSDRIEKIQAFLDHRLAGGGPALPAATDALLVALTKIGADIKSTSQKSTSQDEFDRQLKQMLPLLRQPNSVRPPS